MLLTITQYEVAIVDNKNMNKDWDLDITSMLNGFMF